MASDTNGSDATITRAAPGCGSTKTRRRRQLNIRTRIRKRGELAAEESARVSRHKTFPQHRTTSNDFEKSMESTVPVESVESMKPTEGGEPRKRQKSRKKSKKNKKPKEPRELENSASTTISVRRRIFRGYESAPAVLGVTPYLPPHHSDLLSSSSSLDSSSAYFREYLDKNTHMLEIITDAVIATPTEQDHNPPPELIDCDKVTWAEQDFRGSLESTLRPILHSLGGPPAQFCQLLHLHLQNVRALINYTVNWHWGLIYITPLLALNYRNETNFINAFDAGCILVRHAVDRWDEPAALSHWLYSTLADLILKSRCVHAYGARGNECAQVAFETALYLASYSPMSQKLVDAVVSSRTTVRRVYADELARYRINRAELLRVLLQRSCAKSDDELVESCAAEIKASLCFEPSEEVTGVFDAMAKQAQVDYAGYERLQESLAVYKPKVSRWRSLSVATIRVSDWLRRRKTVSQP